MILMKTLKKGEIFKLLNLKILTRKVNLKEVTMKKTKISFKTDVIFVLLFCSL